MDKLYKNMLFSFLTVSLSMLGCRLGSYINPTPTLFQVTRVTYTDTPTATPLILLPGTTAPGATPTPTRGYAIQFTQQASSGMATLKGKAHSCPGPWGLWIGEVELAFSTEGMQFGGTGPLQFEVTEGEHQAEGEVWLSASGVGKQCTLTQISDPLKFEITFSQDWQSAQMIIGSTGEGMMTIVCPGDHPIEATIPFAAFWGPEPSTLPITRIDRCP